MSGGKVSGGKVSGGKMSGGKVSHYLFDSGFKKLAIKYY